jgi:hypothetical protein
MTEESRLDNSSVFILAKVLTFTWSLFGLTAIYLDAEILINHKNYQPSILRVTLLETESGDAGSVYGIGMLNNKQVQRYMGSNNSFDYNKFYDSDSTYQVWFNPMKENVLDRRENDIFFPINGYIIRILRTVFIFILPFIIICVWHEKDKKKFIL